MCSYRYFIVYKSFKIEKSCVFSIYDPMVRNKEYKKNSVEFNANFTHLNMFNNLNLVNWQIGNTFQVTHFIKLLAFYKIFQINIVNNGSDIINYLGALYNIFFLKCKIFSFNCKSVNFLLCNLIVQLEYHLKKMIILLLLLRNPLNFCFDSMKFYF